MSVQSVHCVRVLLCHPRDSLPLVKHPQHWHINSSSKHKLNLLILCTIKPIISLGKQMCPSTPVSSSDLKP